MTEFRALVDAARVVQRRILANSLLHYWNRYVAWGLAGVLLAAAFLSLHTVLIAAAILAVFATAVAIAATWVTRPSTYEATCRLDQAAGLHDRLSTALHFSTIEDPDEMIKHQRQDALGRLGQADPRALFTLRVPASLGRTAAIAIAAIGLMVYRVNHQAPLLAVSQQVAQSRLARALLTPRPLEKEQEFKEKLLLADDREAVEADSDEKAGLDQAPDAESEQASASQDQGEPSAPSDDDASSEAGDSADPDPNAAAQEADRQAQSGDGREPADRQKQDPQASSAQQQDKPSTSLAQKITQALKDLLAKATGQTPKDQQNEKKMQPPPGNEPQQSQNAQQQNPNGQNPGGQPAKPQSEASEAKANGAGPQMTGQQGEGNAPNGKGSGTPQLSHNAAVETHPTADVVPLAATTFKGQASVLTSAQAGQALLPLRDTAAPSTATSNGAEPGDVPLRYRAYVQQYFNHPDPNHPDKVQR